MTKKKILDNDSFEFVQKGAAVMLAHLFKMPAQKLKAEQELMAFLVTNPRFNKNVIWDEEPKKGKKKKSKK